MWGILKGSWGVLAHARAQGASDLDIRPARAILQQMPFKAFSRLSSPYVDAELT